MRDQLQVSLQDDELLAEVELCTTLMIASLKCDRLLTGDEVDQFLGLSPGPRP